MRWQKGELGGIAIQWFEVIRKCENDVREVLHDGHPTACVIDAVCADMKQRPQNGKKA